MTPRTTFTFRPRSAIVIAVVGLALMTVTAGVASAAISRVYVGGTPQNGFVYGETTTREGRTRLRYMFVEPVIMTCQNSTSFVWGFSFFSDSRRGTPLGSDNRIDVEYRDITSVALFEGRYWPRHARGSIHLTLAGLDANDQAMLCTSGAVQWEADRVRVRGVHAPPLDTSRLDGVTRMRVTDDGTVRVRTQRL